MDRKTLYMIAVMLLLAAAAALAPQSALAADAGVVITNTATVNYQVGGIPQTAVTGSISFVVDRRINMMVTNLANVTSAPSATYQAVQFLVTNTSNTTIRFELQALSRGTNTWTLTGANIYRDNNNNGLWDAGDQLYGNAGTFGDIATNASVTVLIVGDIPASLPNGAAAVYDLLATAVDAGTTNASTETAGAGTMAGVDTVFVDGAGSIDATRSGSYAAAGTFTISTATIAVAKAAAVYSDPSNGTTNPKAIPGAVIIYTVTVTNSAGAAASNVSVTDNMSAMMSGANPSLAFRTPFNDGTTVCAAGQDSVVSINGPGGPWTCQAGTWNAGTFTLTATVPGAINAGGSAIIRYQVTVQ